MVSFWIPFVTAAFGVFLGPAFIAETGHNETFLQQPYGDVARLATVPESPALEGDAGGTIATLCRSLMHYVQAFVKRIIL